MIRARYAILAVLLPVACAPAGSDGRQDNSDLQASCEALVAARTGTRPQDVQALSTTSEPTGSTTKVAVTGADAPWLCRADASGVVTDVEYSQEG